MPAPIIIKAVQEASEEVTTTLSRMASEARTVEAAEVAATSEVEVAHQVDSSAATLAVASNAIKKVIWPETARTRPMILLEEAEVVVAVEAPVAALNAIRKAT